MKSKFHPIAAIIATLCNQSNANESKYARRVNYDG